MVEQTIQMDQQLIKTLDRAMENYNLREKMKDMDKLINLQ